ncbi:MAG: hypothetical protein ABSG25_12250 [Bryobacteraceae bacterium]
MITKLFVESNWRDKSPLEHDYDFIQEIRQIISKGYIFKQHIINDNKDELGKKFIDFLINDRPIQYMKSKLKYGEDMDLMYRLTNILAELKGRKFKINDTNWTNVDTSGT